jgi:AAA15 family ATPase/GTPase
MKATNITDFGDTNLIHTERHNVLKGAVIYGANSSGKSNLIKAMSTMRRIVFQSFEKSSTSDLNIEPFLLDTISETEPSFFEVTFLLNNIKYRYGFELTNSKINKTEVFGLTSFQKEDSLNHFAFVLESNERKFFQIDFNNECF